MVLQPSRRHLLIGGAAVLGLGVAGCSVGDIPTIPALPGNPDDDVRNLAITGEQALISEYRTAIRAHPALAGSLEPILDQHSEHLAALTGQDPTSAPSPSRLDSKSGRAATIKQLRKSERRATRLGTDLAVAAKDPELAMLLARISCSERSHMLLLSGDL